MLRARSAIGLALVTVAAVGFAVFTTEESEPVVGAGDFLFPSMFESVNDAGRVEISAKGKSVVVEKKGDDWVVPTMHGYGASVGKIRALLMGSANLERVEPKTANPDLYAKLGVDPPSTDESRAVSYKITSASGVSLAHFIVGDSQAAKGHPEKQDYYIRLEGDAQSWLVMGNLPVGTDVSDWVDQSVLKLDPARVHRVRVLHPDGSEVVVSKPQASDDDFTLENAPEGTKPKDEWRFNDIGRGMSDLELASIAGRVGETTVITIGGYSVELTTFDGLRVKMHTGEQDNATYGTVTASYDYASRMDRSESSAILDEATVKAEVESLNAKWSGWVYELRSYKSDFFKKKMADLTEVASTSAGG